MDEYFIRVNENISSSYTYNCFVCFDVATEIYYFGEQNNVVWYDFKHVNYSTTNNLAYSYCFMLPSLIWTAEQHSLVN